MFTKFTNFLDEKLSTPMARFSEQRHLRAIRDGIISTLPIIIVGSFFLVIAFSSNQMPDSWALKGFIEDRSFEILLPYRMSAYIVSLYAVFGMGSSLARSYDLDGIMGGLLSELAFLLTVTPTAIPEISSAIESTLYNEESLAYLASSLSEISDNYIITASDFGSASIFVAVLASFFAVEVYRLIMKTGFKIKMPPSVPDSVAKSFEVLVPVAIIFIVVGGCCQYLNFDIHSFIENLIAPLVSGTDTLAAVLFLVFLEMFFWAFGIHGSSIVYSLVRPLWLVMLDENAAAYAAGNAIPHIASEPFFQWFVQIGGSGAILGLAIVLVFFSKSAYAKAMGKVTIIPSIFNISEPMVFGLPLVLNPCLIIPFIFIPLINVVISWFAFSLGFVSKLCGTIVPWTLPGPIGAYLATGGDWKATVLSLILIALSAVLYYPFVKLYKKVLLKEEQAEEEEKQAKNEKIEANAQ